jgi:hypothetical protein
MKRLLIIILVVIVAIIIGALIFFVVQRNNAGGGAGSTSTATLPPVVTSTPVGPAPTGTTLTLGTSEGNVTVNNFYNNPVFITQDQQTVVLAQSSTYSIVYNVSDSSFTISLLSAPFSAARQAAEAALLSSLGISQQDACKLKVSEGVPISVSDEYPGENFPLSFCGSSPPLE